MKWWASQIFIQNRGNSFILLLEEFSANRSELRSSPWIKMPSAKGCCLAQVWASLVAVGCLRVTQFGWTLKDPFHFSVPWVINWGFCYNYILVHHLPIRALLLFLPHRHFFWEHLALSYPHVNLSFFPGQPDLWKIFQEMCIFLRDPF